MSVSDPGEKIEWGADSEPRKNERVPSSGNMTLKNNAYFSKIRTILIFYLTNPKVKSYSFNILLLNKICEFNETFFCVEII